jgi:hypothetical protein
MEIISIPDSSHKDKIKRLNDALANKKHIFMLIYMNGCGPCNQVRPQWKEIEKKIMKMKKNNTILLDIEHTSFDKININQKPFQFPTIQYISHSGKIEDFDPNVERTTEQFIKWIDSKMKHQKGGGTFKYNKSKKIKKSKKNQYKNKRKIKSYS